MLQPESCVLGLFPHHTKPHPASGDSIGSNRRGGLQQTLGEEVVDEDPNVVVIKGQQLGPRELRSRELTAGHDLIPLCLQKQGPTLLEKGEEGRSVG